MKKNFFKKLAATLALAMVVTSVAPAATASAAAGITLKNGSTASTVYATKAYQLKLGKSVKATWKSSNKAVATVGLTGAVLKPVKSGKVTITAKSKTTGKTYKKTYTVKQRATSVELGNDLSLAAGDTAQLNAKLTPSTSTDLVRYFSDNKEVATVGMTGGLVKAVKAGEATITVYAKASKASSNKSAFTKVDTIKVAVGTFIESAVQDSVKKLAVTFNADMKDAKATEFTITSDTTNRIIAIKSASIKGKVVTLETYTDINDGETYTVVYGESDYKFVATDGKVATLAIGPATITYDKETEIKLYAKDANGVIIKEMKYDDVESEYDFDIDVTDGYTTGSELVLQKVGDTAKATATRHTYEYDDAGKELGAIKVEQTITAVDASLFAAGEYKYSVEKTDDGEPHWSDFTQNTKLAIDEDDDYSVYLYLEDNNGDEVDNEDFTLETSNDDVLIVNDETDDDSINAAVRAVDKGTAYVLVKNEDDKVVLSLPITIVAERETSALVLSDTLIELSNSTIVDDRATVEVKVKDQYGKELSEVEATDIGVKCESSPKGIDKGNVGEGVYYDRNDGEIVFKGKDLTEGKYKYKVTVDDYSKYVTVKIGDPGTLDKDDASYELKLNKKTADVVIKAGNTDDITIEARVARLNDDVLESYISITDIDKQVVIKKDGDKVSKEWVDSYASISGGALIIKALEIDDTKDVTKIDAASYSVEIKVKDTVLDKDVKLNSKFVIKDSQAGITWTLENKEVDESSMKDAIAEAFKFEYRGDELDIDGNDILKFTVNDNDYTDDIDARDGRSYRIEKVTFTLDIEVDDTDYKVPFTVEINKTISIED